jgi:hypothetical protein
MLAVNQSPMAGALAPVRATRLMKCCALTAEGTSLSALALPTAALVVAR